MARAIVALFAAAAAIVLCSVFLLSLGRSQPDAPTGLSIKLLHGDISVRASSFPSASETESVDADLIDIQAIAASITDEDVRALSEDIFEKSKFSSFGSHNNGSAASFSTRKLRSKSDDVQFFVQFSTPADIYTLAALGKFSGRHVVSHVHDNLFVAIGDQAFASKARRFPGVVWVQERAGADKLGGSLKLYLDRLADDTFITKIRRHYIPSTRVSDSNPVVTLVAQCWYDACGIASVKVKHLCSDVYVHPGMVEVVCAADMVTRAASLLSSQVGIEHIEIKQVMETQNFAGSAIVGTGPLASSPAQSRVLSQISVTNSVIAVADSGINMNNCFFHPMGRVVAAYRFFDCTHCGSCNGQSASAANACGNNIDESGHGTHVSGTVAGHAAANPAVSAGNGVAAGARIFFQDMMNGLNSLRAPTTLRNMFQEAYDFGARVHTNSWGCGRATPQDPFRCGTYSMHSQDVDEFVFQNRDFLVLFAAGNTGQNSFSRTVSSPGTCKNCITVGATQLSDSLFRGMSPLVDQGEHCRPNLPQLPGCCSNHMSCVQSSAGNCCEASIRLRMSLPCCPTQFTCAVGSANCPQAPTVDTGNIRHAYNVADFSSRGTTFDDGRIKPDLVVPGEDILSAASPRGNPPTQQNYCGIPSPTVPRTTEQFNNLALRITSGTSMAAPLAAGAVEKLRQYFVQGRYPTGNPGGVPINPDESLLRAVILASAKPLGENNGGGWTSVHPSQPGFSRFRIPPSNNIPDIFGGFGMPVLDDAVTMPGGTHTMFFTSETILPSSPASAFTVSCTPGPIPVTLVLAWTDPPGSVSSRKQLVNDLDLIVLVPARASSQQLFGNMRLSADESNVVERTVCSCPAGGVITAIVRQGETIRTDRQTWYLVANGPISSAIQRMVTIPEFNPGRITAPFTTTTSCLAADRTWHTLNFRPGQVWTEERGSWLNRMRLQEFTTSLASFVRVNHQAINIFLPQTADGTVTVSLGCSSMITGSNRAVSFVTAASLRNTIFLRCSRPGSVCRRDPILNAFDWVTGLVDAPPQECANGILCAHRQTCMSSDVGAGNMFACSPLPNAVRCSDARYSCPAGHTCTNGRRCQANGVVSNAYMNVRAFQTASHRDFGRGLQPMSESICGAIVNNLNLPNFCRCTETSLPNDPRSRGATIVCRVGVDTVTQLNVFATIMPCASAGPTHVSVSGNLVNTAPSSRRIVEDGQGLRRFANILDRLNSFRISIHDVSVNLGFTGQVLRSNLQSNVIANVCLRNLQTAQCNIDGILPITFTSGTFDFAGLCPL